MDVEVHCEGRGIHREVGVQGVRVQNLGGS